MHKQSHGDRSRVPTTGYVLTEKRCLSCLRVKVKWLRIELLRECLDLRGIERVARRSELQTDVEVFELGRVVS